jgi:anhydro-N-acetylmuramic acid kinase
MERLLRIYKKERRLVAGLMSGTSLDGIDVALVKIEGSGFNSRIEQVAFRTVGYEPSFRQDILAACRRDTSDVEMLCSLNFALGERFAAAVKEVCQENNVSVADLDLIGSHGQTVWHLPGNSTLQIGEAAVIAERTGVITVSDFRVRDVAAGGQGAPLVPYTEYLLYRDPLKTRLLQNIGGIANVTVLPAGGGPETIMAFDTGLGNMMIDCAVRVITDGRRQFDQDGEMAKRGNVDTTLLSELMAHPYLTQPPPKTTGREVFGDQFTADVVKTCLARGASAADIVATFTCFTAKSIADSYRRFIFADHQVDEVIIGGGGSHNQTLLDLLRYELPGIPVRTQEELGFSSDAKEAVAFAILANEAISGRTNNLPAVTGARAPVIMGKISL